MRRKYLIFGLLTMALLMVGGSKAMYLSSFFDTPAVVKAESLGRDGDLVVTEAGTIVNRYAILARNAAAGDASILVTYPGGENGLRADQLAPGDLILIMQMAGATIATSNDPGYGQVTSLNNAGRYEYVTISRVDGGLLTLNPPCGGLLNEYTVNGKVQIIRVPRYNSLTVSTGASLTAPPWNGSFGGIVAVQVDNNAVIDGEINVSGRGFRGGLSPNLGGATGRLEYVSAQQEFGAEKGEGIAGYQQGYDQFGGRYGRGAAANAGGGGTAHNSGGGGGANGNNGADWTGQGVMDSAAVGAAAWQNDPAYIAGGNQLARSSGGGRGGYSYAVNNADALVNGPGSDAWGGDMRRSVGGLGGRPLVQDPASRIFMGGGGGGGAQNDLSGGGGGNAGGMIYIIAKSVSGNGLLRSNGNAGENTRNQNRDGAGGGGAGGTIVVYADSLNGLRAEARGGKGGDQLAPIVPNASESQGPGGGGGGGYVAFKGGTMTVDVGAGRNGITNSIALTEFPSNGATGGADGQVVSNLTTIPYCSAIADLSITNTNNSNFVVPGLTTTYTIVATNNGPSAIYGAEIVDTLPAGFIQSSKAWTCTASNGSSCAAASGNGDIATRVNLRSGGTVTFTLTALLDPAYTGFVNNVARINPPAGATETASPNNEASDNDVATPQADLAVTMVGDEPKFVPGTSVTFQIEIHNLGPSVAVGFGLVDQLPDYISLIRLGCTATNGSCGNNVTTGNLIQYAAMNLGVTSNNLVRITVVGFINPAAVGELSNTAALVIPPVAPPVAPVGGGSGTSGSGFFDPNTASNSATVRAPLSPEADLVITKTNNQSQVVSGTNTTYQIEVTNLGPSDATSFNITDNLPASLTVLSVNCVATGGSCGLDASSGNLVQFNNASLPFGAGRSIRLTIAARLNVESTGTLSNTAVVDVTSGAVFSDPVPNNNMATDVDPIILQADLAVTMTGPINNLIAGSRVTYNIEVTNGGPSSSPLTSIVNTLPAALESATWTCVATAGSSCSAATGTGGLNTTVNLAVNGKVNFILSANLSRTYGGPVVNQIVVNPPAGTEDPVLNNNEAFNQITVIRSEGPTFIIGQGLSKLVMSQPFRIALDAAGLNRLGTGNARLYNQTLNLPVEGGAIDLFTAAGEILHSGGLSLWAGKKRIQIYSINIDTLQNPAVLTGVVVVSDSWDQLNTGSVLGRATLAEFTLPSSVTLPIKPQAFNSLYVHQAGLTLSDDLATILNSFFGVTNFVAGSDLGKLSFQLIGVPERIKP
jgi:fimbrial isopeptide formation D2 family protein/uncharacterized repeat protein (TIGR01451 family)